MINKLSARYGKREAYMLFIGLWVLIQAVGTMLLTPSMTLNKEGREWDAELIKEIL